MCFLWGKVEHVLLYVKSRQGSFILVSYPTKGKDKVYLGQILQIDADTTDIEVKFLRSVDACKLIFRFPPMDDIDWITPEQILGDVKEEYTITNRGLCTFKNAIDVLE